MKEIEKTANRWEHSIFFLGLQLGAKRVNKVSETPTTNSHIINPISQLGHESANGLDSPLVITNSKHKLVIHQRSGEEETASFAPTQNV